MKRIFGLGAGCALVTAAFLLLTPAARAQSPPMVTITFKLTVNGSVPAHEGLSVSWPESGILFCPSSCVGAGHTYSATMQWPQGNQPIHFTFQAGTSKFGQQTVTPATNRTVSAFFTFAGGGASAPTPATGLMTPPLGIGAGLVLVGSAAMLLAVRRRSPPANACSEGRVR